jgi:hypothetical protein
MTASEFRKLALSHPGAVESAHMSHPDFRVGGRIFATVGYPDERHAVVMLSPDEQEGFVAEMPRAFGPVKGAWGKRGSTQIDLRAADTEAVAEAIRLAWRRRAPARLRTTAS